MRFSAGCDECLLSRVEYECRLVSDDEERIRATIDACQALLDRVMGADVPAPVIASQVHRLAYRLIGSTDPYATLKEQNNRDALAVANAVRHRLKSFRDYALASIIGNTLDYGSKAHSVTDDFVTFFDEEFARGLTIDHCDAIEAHSSRVVYLSDNCGEIVFDRLVIGYLKEKGARVTLAVRGAPIINDATMEDALALDLDNVVDHLTTTTAGFAELGLNLSCVTPDLADEIERSSIIIAKGMANYESLSEYRDLPPIAYLMSVKCDPIARSIGAPKGSRIAFFSE